MPDVAASFQQAVVDVLCDHTLLAARDLGMDRVAIAGGVAANSSLRRQMEAMCTDRGTRFCYPSPVYCTDNAAMIGTAGYYEYLRGSRSGWDLNAVPGLKIGQR